MTDKLEFPAGWRSLRVTELRELLAPWGSPHRHSMRRAQLIRTIEQIMEERQHAVRAYLDYHSRDGEDC